MGKSVYAFALTQTVMQVDLPGKTMKMIYTGGRYL